LVKLKRKSSGSGALLGLQEKTTFLISSSEKGDSKVFCCSKDNFEHLSQKVLDKEIDLAVVVPKRS
jgi:hypothetical protein